MADKDLTVAEYLAALPEDRRAALEEVRKVILDNLNPGFEEGIQYGMLGYYVPHSVYPQGYHANPKVPLPCFNLASQKSHLALYLLCLYPETQLSTWFRTAWEGSGKKLDMGKSCVRFKKTADVPLDVVGELVRRVTVDKYVATYEAALAGSKKGRTTKSAKEAPPRRSPSTAKARTEKSPASPVKKSAKKKATRKASSAR